MPPKTKRQKQPKPSSTGKGTGKGERDDKLTPFRQHGFKHAGDSGNQAFGVCPFCGHKEHKHSHTFYVNKDTHRWDCKSCGREGGFQTFLKLIAEEGEKNFTKKRGVQLARDRGIKFSTFRSHGVGYNVANDTYILPTYDVEGEKVWNIYYYKIEGHLRGTATCSLPLMGWQRLNEKVGEHGTVILCEGHWDFLAAHEVAPSGAIVAGLPGSKLMRAEWANWFSNKDVIVVLDNDEAGNQGSMKIHNHIARVVSSVKYVHWPDDKPKGYDLRDLYIQHGADTYMMLQTFLRDYPPGAQRVEVAKQKFTGKGLKPAVVYRTFKKWLKFPDGVGVDIIDVMFGTALSDRLKNPPVWMFVVGASGGGKSEPLMSLLGAPNIHSASNFTSKSLISGAAGAGGSDPSLIPMWDGKCIVIKDFTVLLSLSEFERKEIFAILRDAYDGFTQREVGTGNWRAYKCHFSMIAGVTRAIELEVGSNTSLGERFIRWDLPVYTRKQEREIISKATQVARDRLGPKMKEELSACARKVLDYEFNSNVSIPAGIDDKLISLAQYTAMLRGFVNRLKYTDEATHRAMMEVPTRLASSYTSLGMGIEMFHHSTTMTERTLDIVRHVARSTAPSRCQHIIEGMWRGGVNRRYTVDQICEFSGLSKVMTRRVLDDLKMVDAVRRVEEGERLAKTIYYTLTDDLIEIIEHSEVFK